LKVIINAKHTTKGIITKLKELLRSLFHILVNDRDSFKERIIISPITTMFQCCGIPGLVIIVTSLGISKLELRIGNIKAPI